jgi:adenylate cyclase, class 2
MHEIEIKIRIHDSGVLLKAALAAGLREVTPRTLEQNTLYDTPDRTLRLAGQLLRLRLYGKRWVLTHKRKLTAEESAGQNARHKVRVETETEVADGPAVEQIFNALGMRAVFRYEKFRTEWGDGTGHLTIDETPIGEYAELEGPPEWIDATAQALGISESEYLQQSYGELFSIWKRETGSPAENMTFAEISAVESR